VYSSTSMSCTHEGFQCTAWFSEGGRHLSVRQEFRINCFCHSKEHQSGYCNPVDWCSFASMGPMTSSTLIFLFIIIPHQIRGA